MQGLNYFGALLAYIGMLQNVFAEAPSCDSEIYCGGDLLRTVQMAKLFEDSKTFVDMGLNNSPKTVLQNFQILMTKTNNQPTKQQIQQFVDDNFQHEFEIEKWKAPDFNPNPPFLQTITVPAYRKFAKDLVQIWATLSRIIKPDVFAEPDRYSIIPVPNGFVIPGGRFREFYYWDSYWIIKGLLASGMKQTVKGMLENFLSVVERYGFVPNGGRIYYLNRSQPPLLSLMVNEYLEETNDIPWLKKNLHLIQKELKYWLKTQTITLKIKGVKHNFAQYSIDSPSPRPESYREDVATCSPRTSSESIKNCYKDLKSGAESGWDFSSRWFFDDEGPFGGNLTNIETRRVIPVDLNAFLAQAFGLVAYFSAIAGDNNSQDFWNKKRNVLNASIHSVLFNQTDKIWYDLDIELLKHRRGFYPSNLAPLWCRLVGNSRYGDFAVDYLEREGVLCYPEGIPASRVDTGEQWDFPDAWPPLQSIVILGLKRSESPKALRLAEKLAKRWIHNNMVIFNRTGYMYEKYNAKTAELIGGGGEYVAQTGFGWSNGVIFELIGEFYSKQKKSGCIHNIFQFRLLISSLGFSSFILT